jgi:hypothetical protein
MSSCRCCTAAPECCRAERCTGQAESQSVSVGSCKESCISPEPHKIPHARCHRCTVVELRRLRLEVRVELSQGTGRNDVSVRGLRADIHVDTSNDVTHCVLKEVVATIVSGHG